jgi:hypothetical protein
MADIQTLPPRESVVDTMIELTRLKQDHRVIITGSDSFDFYLALHRRGFRRSATTATCRVARSQHDIGLLAGWRSMLMLEGKLSQLVPFLHSGAVLALWADVHERARSREIQALLDRWGFRIEAGASCGDGYVLSAKRRERLAQAA